MILIIFVKDQEAKKKIGEAKKIWRRARIRFGRSYRKCLKSNQRGVFAVLHGRMLIMSNGSSKWSKWKKKSKDEEMEEEIKRGLCSFWCDNRARRRVQKAFSPSYPQKEKHFSEVPQMRRRCRCGWFGSHPNRTLSSFDLMSSIPTLS